MDANNTTTDDRAFEHAWKSFEIHSNHRMTLFNFFVVFTGLNLTAFGAVLLNTTSNKWLEVGIGLSLVLISFLFWKVDQRISCLIKTAEESLADFELVFQSEKSKIFSQDKNINNVSKIKNIWTLGKCFRATFILVALIGLYLSIVSILL